MTTLPIYRPARAGLVVPMPDRGGRAMLAEGEAVDLDIAYYRRLRDDGDIVPAETQTGRRARRKRKG